MKTLTIFLASSIIEFDYERIFIGDFIRKLNDQFRPIGYKVRLYMCEDEYINSQPFYDRLIESSDIFILLVGQRLGDFSKHELVDIADVSTEIKKKVIVLRSENSRDLIPPLNSSYAVHVLGKDPKHELQSIISDLIEETIITKDEVLEISTAEDFLLGIPKAEKIEVAVLNNIIRRLNDQNHNIVVHDDNYDGSENAYVSIITESLTTEIERLKSILINNANTDNLWIFADANLSSEKLQTTPTTKGLVNVIDNIIKRHNNYPTYYQDIKSLAREIEIRLFRALQTTMKAEKAAEKAAFIYVLEDHWLIQKSLITGRKTLKYNLWDITLDCPIEKALRKERVIVNLLNIYWLSGQIDKHVDAWTKLEQKKFDEIFYTLDNLDEVKAKEYGQAFIDYICDTLELILSQSFNHDSQWLHNKLNEICEITSSRTNISNAHRAMTYIYIGDAYSVLDDYINIAIDNYEQAFLIDKDKSSEILKVKLSSLINLCGRLIDQGQMGYLTRVCKIGLSITDKTDTYYWLLFKMTESVSNYQDQTKQWETQMELQPMITPHALTQDNRLVEISIIQIILSLQIELQNQRDISVHLNTIEYCINLYHKYLSFDVLYKYLLSALLSLKARAVNSIQLSQQAIDIYVNTYHTTEFSKFYCDLIYNKGSIELKNSNYIEAASLFKELANAYNAKYDKGCSYQSSAICYMNLYYLEGSLTQAEELYNQALSCFKTCGDKRMYGNILDGLSFCFLLQKRFKEAEQTAIHAIQIKEYNDINKYVNLISSLLCQGKLIKAFNIYKSATDKRLTIELLFKDWNKEIKDVGINNRTFKLFKFLIPRYTYSK